MSAFDAPGNPACRPFLGRHYERQRSNPARQARTGIAPSHPPSLVELRRTRGSSQRRLQRQAARDLAAIRSSPSPAQQRPRAATGRHSQHVDDHDKHCQRCADPKAEEGNRDVARSLPCEDHGRCGEDDDHGYIKPTHVLHRVGFAMCASLAVLQRRDQPGHILFQHFRVFLAACRRQQRNSVMARHHMHVQVIHHLSGSGFAELLDRDAVGLESFHGGARRSCGCRGRHGRSLPA